VKLHIKRLDLLHPTAPGNKYFKLKYNLLKAKDVGATTIVTVGGPFSNHLHAVAASCREAEIECIGLVHGQKPAVLSHTLTDCLDWGMKLEFVEREWYAQRDTEAFKQWVRETFELSYFIPEGGSNFLGVNGCMEILDAADKAYDTIAVPVGSATTLAGLVLTAHPRQRILAFAALHDQTLPEKLEKQLYYTLMDAELAADFAARVEWVFDYTFGGFAKTTPELLAFMEQQAQNSLPLDKVYTAKMIFGLHDLAEKGKIGQDETVLAIHTGGLQGNRGLVSTPAR
jgi:1-aminocyclopropane-1-carboxylate deaminase